MAMLEISVVPVGTGTPSVSGYVARAVDVLRQARDVKYELTAMGTIIEGDLETLFLLAKRMHEAVLAAGATRVVTTIKIDDRRDKPSGMKQKVEAVRRKLVK